MHVYRYGETASFGVGGDGYRFRGHGWGETEKSFTWTVEPRARLLFRVPPSRNRLQLQILMNGHTKPPDLPFQPVEVSVNGVKCADWEVTSEAQVYSVMIPRSVVADGALLTVDLHIPRAISPLALGGPPDPRTLGLKCYEVRIIKHRGAAALARPAS